MQAIEQVKTYTGPSGPTYEQNEEYVTTLFAYLKQAGVQCNLSKYTDPDCGTTDIAIYITKYDTYVIHDRWGFCDCKGNLDQASTADTVAYFAGR